MLRKLNQRLLVGVIIVLIGVIVYLLFFQENPCDKKARLFFRANQGEELSDKLKVELLAAAYKCPSD